MAENREPTMEIPRVSGMPPSPAFPDQPGPGNRPKKSAAARKKRRKLIRRIILLVILAGAGFGVWRTFFAGNGGSGGESVILRDVVQYGAITATVEGSGLTRAKNSETMVLAFPGTVQEVLVEEGDIVSAGDPLFVIDSEEARKAVSDAEDGVTKAREAVTTAQEAVATAQDRVRSAQEGIRTAEDNVITAEENVLTAQEGVETARERVVTARDGIETAEEAVTAAREAVETAKEGVETAKENKRKAEKAVDDAREAVRKAEQAVEDADEDVREAEDKLAETRDKREKLEVRAPWRGKLLDIHRYYNGDEIASDTVVAVLADDTRFRLTQWYSRAYINDIWEGQPARVYIPSLPDTVDGFVESVNRIDRISPDGSGGYFSVDIVADNPGGLTSEMSAAASIFTDSGEAYPNNELGKLEYFRTTDMKAEMGGKVLEIHLENHRPVEEGELLLWLDDSTLKDEIKAKEDALREKRDIAEDKRDAVETAEQGVRDALKAVETAEKGITEAEKGVTTAEKGVTTALKGVEDARKNVETQQKGITDAERGVDNARRGVDSANRAVDDAHKGVTDAEKGVEDARKNVEDQQKGVIDAQEKVAKAEENLAKCSAVAPIDGRVIGLDLTAGEEVNSGRAAMTISDTSTIVVNATVDERNMGYIKKGMMVELDQWGTPATGIVESVSLSSTVNNGVATYPMVISVDNADGSLQINSNIRYSLVASQNDNCLIVPVQCVRNVSTEDGESITVVYVEGDTPPDNAVDGVMAGEMIPDGFWPVQVEIGIQDTYNVEIRSGLEEGQTVFTQMQSAMGGMGMFF